MGELSEKWGGHLADSAVTGIVQDALANRPEAEMDMNVALTMILGEIAVMQQMVLDLCVAVDRLMETG